MSNEVRLSSRLAKDEETNGLDHLAGDLKNNPDQVICAITWLTVEKLTTDVQEHTTYPTVAIKRIEPIGVVGKVPQEVIELAASLFEERLNRAPLPFDVTEVIEGGYKNPEIMDEDGSDDE